MKKIITLLVTMTIIMMSKTHIYAMDLGGTESLINVRKTTDIVDEKILEVKLRKDIVNKPLSEFENVTIIDNSINCSSDSSILSSEISGTKTQTVSMYLRDAGKYAGKCTLSYKTQILGGRPQFVYESCTLSESWSSNMDYYVVTMPDITFSGDRIEVRYYTQIGLISDVIVVVFNAK